MLNKLAIVSILSHFHSLGKLFYISILNIIFADKFQQNIFIRVSLLFQSLSCSHVKNIIWVLNFIKCIFKIELILYQWLKDIILRQNINIKIDSQRDQNLKQLLLNNFNLQVKWLTTTTLLYVFPVPMRLKIGILPNVREPLIHRKHFREVKQKEK